MKKAKRTALCGMLTALSVVLMATTAIVPAAMYILPIFTGIIVMLVHRSMSVKYALGVFFATSFLCLVLITDKEAALTYALFFGYYPVIKGKLESIPKWLSWVLKLIIFNCAAVLVGVLSVYLFGVSGEEYSDLGKLTVPILLGLSNVVFLMYDISLTKNGILIDHFSSKIRKKLR